MTVVRGYPTSKYDYPTPAAHKMKFIPAVVGAKYYTGSVSYGNDDNAPLQVSSTGELKVTGSFAATLNAGDIQIGAVEIKDAASSARVRVAIPADIDDSHQTIAVTDARLNEQPTVYSSTTLESGSLVQTGGDGVVHAIWGYNDNSSAQFIQLHNSSSFPIEGDTPVTVIKAAANDNFYFDLSGVFGISCGIGISVCNSSTVATKTSGSNDVWFNVAYKIHTPVV